MIKNNKDEDVLSVGTFPADTLLKRLEIELPDGRIFKCPPAADWWEEESREEFDKYRMRALSAGTGSVILRPSDILEGKAMECVDLPEPVMHDLKKMIDREALWVRKIIRYRCKPVDPVIFEDPYDYICSSKRGPLTEWPRSGRPGGMIVERKEKP